MKSTTYYQDTYRKDQRALWPVAGKLEQAKLDDYAALFVKMAIWLDRRERLMARKIFAHLHQIFADHVTATYVGKIREVRFLSPEVALLRAVSGMVSPGQTDLNPNVNTIHTLVAVQSAGRWRIALFQSTPAQFHGRPELALALTEELRQLL
jgi:uncharacterized protein (TIGR02246 family)